ncbi:hypothetical protein EDC53_10330 [Phytobacter diazotrophicus]|nr:hypothetical protein EDC53_10330 [Phytobacter diazotrophicus]
MFFKGPLVRSSLPRQLPSVLLVGCATPQPTIPYVNYQRIALADVAANKCVSPGFLDYQIAAAAKNYAARDLNSWTYDPVFYQTTFNEMSAAAEKTPPTKAQCDSFAVAIVQRQQQEQHNYQQQQQALSQSLQTLHNRCRKPPTDFAAGSAGQRSTRYLIGG